jgi:hypothetical protein
MAINPLTGHRPQRAGTSCGYPVDKSRHPVDDPGDYMWMAYSHVTTRSRVNAKPIERKTQAMIDAASRDWPLRKVTENSSWIAQIEHPPPARLTVRDCDLHRARQELRSHSRPPLPRAQSDTSGSLAAMAKLIRTADPTMCDVTDRNPGPLTRRARPPVAPLEGLATAKR